MNLACQTWRLCFDCARRYAPLLAAAGLLSASSPSACLAQVPGLDANQAEVNPGEVVHLEDQLINGLRVVTSDQRAYVMQVVDLVEQGTLPRAMVNVIYTWSLKRNPRVPLPYFQFALKALADRRGINAPPGQFGVD